jgi:hypothetical protein
MPSATRLFVHSMLIAVTAAVALMFAVPAALADGYPSPSTLVFAVQPTTTQVQTDMSPAVVVDVEDSYGKLITSFNGPVTLTLTHAAGVPNFSTPGLAGNTVNASKGVATFPALTVNGVGFGFVLQASAGKVTSAASNMFDIVTQLVQCQSGQACQTGTVSSDGTSGLAAAGAASTSDVLTATGGGFPSLSCTVVGGVVSFTITNRPKTITMMLAKDLVQQIGPGAAHINICWGSPTKFTTLGGTMSAFNMANNEYEGLLPDCSAGGPLPCVASRHKAKAGVEVTTISASAGDPHGTY